MKKITKIFMLLTFGSYCLFAKGNEQMTEMIKHYEELFNSLDKSRKGLTNEQLNTSVDPFISIKNNPIIQNNEKTPISIEPQPEYALYAILNNTAKINNGWYKVGDQVKDYKLSTISKNSVKLTRNNETLILNLTQGNENVVISY